MIKYKCIKCLQEKVKFKTDIRKSKYEWKYVDSENHHIAGKKCYECSLLDQKSKRLKTNNKITKRYEKTPKGFLMRTYRNMKSRVKGIQKLKSHLYAGKDLIDKDQFYSWSLSNVSFNELFTAWTESNFNRRLSPSIDRIDPSKGYFLENMQWIEHWKNSQKGAQSRYTKSGP